MSRAGKHKRYLWKKRLEKIPFLWILLFSVVVLGIVITKSKIHKLGENSLDFFDKKEVVKEEEVLVPLVSRETVRVMIKGKKNQQNYANLFISCDGNYTVKTTQSEQVFSKEQRMNALELGMAEKIIIIPEHGKMIQLVDEQQEMLGVGYPGVIELYKTSEGYVVINEVGVEEYIAGVLPSEMPEEYGLESLKAQAICARTYFYSRSMETGYPQYQALLDDTTMYQVYQQQPQSQLIREAVAQTAGKVMTKNGQIIDALYFSTSCGYTQSGELFGADMDTTTLVSKYVGEPSLQTASNQDWNSFLRQRDEGSWEKDGVYYRWKVRLDCKNKTSEMIAAIQKQKSIKPETIEIKWKTKKKKDKPLEERLGDFKAMQILQRSQGGAVTEINCEFKNGEILIRTELAIRDVLGAAMIENELADGSSRETNRLYSSIFVWDVGQKGVYQLYGGGFGHGVGMSQYGARAMAQMGWNCESILTFYYQGITIEELLP